jgi:hypothetical protein
LFLQRLPFLLCMTPKYVSDFNSRESEKPFS